MGHAYYRFARQADSYASFTERMGRMVLNYEEARSFYNQSSATAKGARTLRCDALLALSLSEVLHAPSLISTAAFSTGILTHERAVGLERFEHGDVQAILSVPTNGLNVGEELPIEIGFFNAGRGQAQLIRLEDIVPAEFELTEKPAMYHKQDGSLDLRGKRLDPLKTEEFRIVLRPKTKGKFTIKPRVRYLDEGGKYKFDEPQPVTISVRELGISGWIKGR